MAKKAKSDEPTSAAASAAASFVGAGSEISIDVILRRDAGFVSPGCRRVLLALLEKGVEFQEVVAEASENAPLPELVLGDKLVHGWENCLLSLEEAVSQVPLLPPTARASALEVMKTTQALMPDEDIRSLWGAKQRLQTMERLQKIENILAASPGDFFLGHTFSLVDVALFPALETCDAQVCGL